jgi:hypothetical protein
VMKIPNFKRITYWYLWKAIFLHRSLYWLLGFSWKCESVLDCTLNK